MARRVVVRIPTRRQAERRILPLVGAVASVGIIVDGLDPFLGPRVSLMTRFAVAFLVAAGTMLFERYKLSRSAS